MDRAAELTGDVIDTRYNSPDGDLFFLLQEGETQYKISLKQIAECLRFAQEKHEIMDLPADFWSYMFNRYPDMYRGEEAFRECDDEEI